MSKQMAIVIALVIAILTVVAALRDPNPPATTELAGRVDPKYVVPPWTRAQYVRQVIALGGAGIIIVLLAAGLERRRQEERRREEAARLQAAAAPEPAPQPELSPESPG